MTKPLRVLCVTGGALNYGGISAFLYSYLKHIDRSRVAVDLVAHKVGSTDAEASFRALGAEIFHVPTKREDFAGNRRALCALFASGDYPVVHAHCDGMNGYVLKLAADCGVPVRISHSHNTDHDTRNPLRRALHICTAAAIPRCATDLWGCSEAADRWLYRGQADRAVVIKNAVEYDDFAFSQTARDELRHEWGVEDRFVIGFAGRLERQKNLFFLLEVLAALRQKRPDAVAFLAGDGSLRPALEEKIAALGLADTVTLLGRRSDVGRLLSAFDVLTMPSLFEGLCISCVEACANGLPCLVSPFIPLKDDLPDALTALPIDDPAVWVEALCRPPQRFVCTRDDLAAAGYEISAAAESLTQRYLAAALRQGR